MASRTSASLARLRPAIAHDTAPPAPQVLFRYSATNLPVIVWVHGGSNITGYTADPAYDFATLARNTNSVVVSVNYRLGLLGFFNLGQLKTGTNALDDSGNFAILDIIKALQFVNRNAASFGGDAGNVTLMGHSAGAVNILAVMTSPLVVGATPQLAHKFVPMSGAISLGSELPAGSIPGLARVVDFRGQADYFLNQMVLADGLATDATAAQTLINGKTNAEIKQYLVERYGDFVLYRPPVQANTALLWGGPFALLAGGGLIWAIVQRRSRLAARESGKSPAATASGIASSLPAAGSSPPSSPTASPGPAISSPSSPARSTTPTRS